MDTIIRLGAPLFKVPPRDGPSHCLRCLGNRYNGHVLSAQLKQTNNLLQNLGRSPKEVIVDLGYRGVDADNPGVQLIHRGKYNSLSDPEKRLLKRRQAIEPLIGDTKVDHRTDRCWLQGAMGHALHALSRAAGYNIRWLLWAIVRLGLGGPFLRSVRCSHVPRLHVARCGCADKASGLGTITAAPTNASSAVLVTRCAWMNSAGPTTSPSPSTGSTVDSTCVQSWLGWFARLASRNRTD